MKYNRYIEFLCDLMAIERPFFNFKDNGRFYNDMGAKIEKFELKPTAKMTTIPTENTIYVDLDKFTDEIDVYLSLAHEIRHCAQYQALNDVGLWDITTPEMLKIWAKELQRYKDSTNKGYENQSIELDAIAFSWLIGRTVFGVEVKANNVNQDELNKYKQYISNIFSVGEIKETQDYWGFEYMMH